MPFAVTVQFKVKSGQMERFLENLQENASASVRDEPGCLQFDICTDPARPDTAFLYEVYEDEAAFEAHQTMPHFAAVGAANKGLVESRVLETFATVIRRPG